MAAYTADLGQFDLIYTVFADMSVKIFKLKILNTVLFGQPETKWTFWSAH